MKSSSEVQTMASTDIHLLKCSRMWLADGKGKGAQDIKVIVALPPQVFLDLR